MREKIMQGFSFAPKVWFDPGFMLFRFFRCPDRDDALLSVGIRVFFSDFAVQADLNEPGQEIEMIR